MSPSREATKTLVIAILYAVVLAFDVWLFLFLPGGELDARIGFFLQILGLYAIGTGLLEQAGILGAFKQSADELTSRNLRTFLAANLTFGGVLLLLASSAVRGVLYAREWYALLVAPVLIVATPVLLLLCFAYLIAVVPIAYLAYLLASVFLVGLSASSPEQITVARGEERLQLGELMAEHLPKVRTFLVGAPTIVLSVLSSGGPAF
jgi:hypothetical protein